VKATLSTNKGGLEYDSIITAYILLLVRFFGFKKLGFQDLPNIDQSDIVVIDHPNGATHDRLIGPPYDRPNGASFKWPF
jgi:hypothetical protein